MFDTFTPGFIEGFRQSGMEVFEADLSQNNVAQLNQALAAKPAFVFSFNGIRAALDVGGRSWHDVTGSPLVVMLLDHPLYHLDVIKEPIENMIFLTVDKKHAKFISQDLGDKRPCYFFPHGGMCAENIPTTKEIDVMFAGSLENPLELQQKINALPKDSRKLVQGIITCMKGQSDLSIEEAARKIAFSNNDSVDPPWFYDNATFLTLADRFVRHEKRYRVLKLLAQEGLLSAWGWGEGWRQLKTEVRDLDFRGEASTGEILQYMGQSKIVLNVLPGFTAGSHERVLSSLRNAAVTISDKSTWLSEEFEEGKEIIFFDWDRLKDLPQQLKALLNNTEHCQIIAENGRKKAEEKHTWACRAKQLCVSMFK